jgi:hypothetical protein
VVRKSTGRSAALSALFERIARWPDPRLGNLLAHELLPGLLSARRTGEALTIVRDRLRADPAFRPQRASEALRMAELARDAGDRNVARQLVSDFAERFPNDPAQLTATRIKTELAR